MGASATGSSSMYIGRFAPSPTGPLHFGSLLAALASYLDAKHHSGLWLLRIDDIDPPREISGASKHIIDTLIAFGFEWDKTIIYQSQRNHIYQEHLNQLIELNLAYPCSCSRKEIKERTNSAYDNHCRSHQNSAEQHAWRFKRILSDTHWQDNLMGQQFISMDSRSDFVIKRRDALWAYQLAVTVDDHLMNITDIIRGSDLLSEAPKQLALIRALSLNQVNFSHIPLATNKQGQKLSKQNFAPPLSLKNSSRDLFLALKMLGQKPDEQLIKENNSDILQQAVLNWDPNAIPAQYCVTFKD